MEKGTYRFTCVPCLPCVLDILRRAVREESGESGESPEKGALPSRAPIDRQRGGEATMFCPSRMKKKIISFNCFIFL